MESIESGIRGFFLSFIMYIYNIYIKNIYIKQYLIG